MRRERGVPQTRRPGVVSPIPAGFGVLWGPPSPAWLRRLTEGAGAPSCLPVGGSRLNYTCNYSFCVGGSDRCRLVSVFAASPPFPWHPKQRPLSFTPLNTNQRPHACALVSQGGEPE